jgi:DNA-binding transcriptional LysR family regulator
LRSLAKVLQYCKSGAAVERLFFVAGDQFYLCPHTGRIFAFIHVEPPVLAAMNLRFVEAFVWVARLKSFKGAAERLHTTQAAISSRIATFEADLGARLFDRDSRSVTLTLRATQILPLAERMLALADQMLQAAGDAAEFTGTLRIGTMESVVHTFLPALLSNFSIRYPKVTVELHSDITPFLRDELLKGTLDCVLTSEEIAEGAIENRRIAALPMAWVASPSLQIAPGPVPFSEIAKRPLITFHKRSVVYRDMLGAGSDPTSLRVNFFSSLAAMISMTRSGFGIATLPLAVIPRELASGELRALDATPPLKPLPVVASIRAGGASSVTEQFSRMAADVFEEFSAHSPPSAAPAATAPT